MTTATLEPTTDAMEQVSAEIEAEQREVVQGAMDAFHSMADEIAVGRKPNTERVSSVLEESKQTLETLTSAVKMRRDRKVWADTVAAAEKSKKKLAKLEATQETEVARFETERQKHHQRLQELSDEIKPLRLEVNQAEEARRKLGTTPYPHPHRQAAQLAKEASTRAALDEAKRKYKSASADLGPHGRIRNKQIALGDIARQEATKVGGAFAGFKDQGSMKANAAAAKKELKVYKKEVVGPAEAELAKMPGEIKLLEKAYSDIAAKRLGA